MRSVDSNAKQYQFALFTSCGDLSDSISVHMHSVRSAQAVLVELYLKLLVMELPVKHFTVFTIKIALYSKHINKTAYPI